MPGIGVASCDVGEIGGDLPAEAVDGLAAAKRKQAIVHGRAVKTRLHLKGRKHAIVKWYAAVEFREDAGIAFVAADGGDGQPGRFIFGIELEAKRCSS